MGELSPSGLEHLHHYGQPCSVDVARVTAETNNLPEDGYHTLGAAAPNS